MDYQHLVRDFARRSRRNLDFIREARKRGEEVYEVTQLVNSMLGLLVLPKERYLQNIPDVSLDDLRRDGWPEPVLNGKFSRVTGLRDLVGALRHSVAHFNIEFTETGGEIDGIQMSNRYGGTIRWQA